MYSTVLYNTGCSCLIYNLIMVKDAVARRLEVYREVTLPMIKSLDEEERLRVVDGDKEDQKVSQENLFPARQSATCVLRQLI